MRRAIIVACSVAVVAPFSGLVLQACSSGPSCEDLHDPSCFDAGGQPGEGGGTDSSTADGNVHVDAGDAGQGHEGGSTGDSGCHAPTSLPCNGSCVDPSSVTNCGSCGNVCAGPEAGTGQGACSSSDGGFACTLSCSGATPQPCNGACVDPNDPAHCGATCAVCPGPQAGSGFATCHSGQCGIACDGDASTTLICGSDCVDPFSLNNCGVCGHNCTAPANATPSCTPGPDGGPGCTWSCNTGYHLCNGACLSDSDDPSADPCVVADGLGTFVAPTGNDSTADGSKEHPFGTITKAIAHSTTTTTGKNRVYACGAFAENVAVDASGAGVTVYGGLSCSTWAYSASTPTSVSAASGFALNVSGLPAAGVTFEDFAFQAAAATGAGGSSIAAVVSNSSGVTFRRVSFRAGAGQTGAPGADGVNSWSGPAATGNSAQGATGGATLACACGGSGGQGGAAGVINASLQVITPASPGSDGQPVGTANHGAAANPPNACGVGTVGNGGAAGSGGAGGNGVGTLSAALGWTNPGTGSAGTAGGFAQGGGGGGGAFYIQGNAGANAGGGGGCGGCGGAPGQGGLAGGSSIALVVVSSSVTLDTCTLTALVGGAGGMGGVGQAGQAGGSGGSASGSSGTCGGGPGGQGGAAGSGGGGPGGHSIAIAYTGTAPTEVGTVTKNVASTPAAGGAPGSGIAAANGQGAPGLAVAERAF